MAPGAQSTAQIAYGVWKLLTFEVFRVEDPNSQPVAQPLGPNPLGMVVISPDGYLNATLTHSDQTKPLKDEDWRANTNEDIARVARAMVTYCGPYEIFQDGDEMKLETTVEISLNPAWMGTVQSRHAAFSEENERKFMTLSPVQYMTLPDGKDGKGVLVWEKCERPNKRASKV